jgi:uncharacterized membrane protein YbhN (UPF0104 family)
MKLFKKHWRLIVGILVSLLAVLFVYQQWDTIIKSIDSLKQANKLYLGVSVVSFIGTIFMASMVLYQLRLINKPTYGQLVLVQTSTLFLGKITPASIGGIAAMARVLVTGGHSVVQSGSIMVAGSVATFLGNVSVTIIALVLASQKVSFADIKIPKVAYFVLLILVIVLIILYFSKFKRVIINKLKEVKLVLLSYKNKKKNLLLAILSGAGLTFCFGLTMFIIAKSLGVELTLFGAIISISMGSLGVAVTPLPGGAIGAELAIAASLSQFGVSSEDALAIAFAYRFITF